MHDNNNPQNDICPEHFHSFRNVFPLELMNGYVVVVVGFKEQIYEVYRYLPPATQVVLVSATLPHEILEMTCKFMTDPIRIMVKR